MRSREAVSALLDSPEPGTHAIYWHDDSDEADLVIQSFLNGAIRRSDLTLIILPRAELHDLTIRLSARGTDLEALVDQGHAIRATFEDLAPHRASDLETAKRDIQALREFARSVGKRGLSVVARVAPVFFENGEPAMAAAIEEASQDARGDTRMLCLYNARTLRAERFSDALAVTRRHTHAITALGGGRFFVEAVQPLLVP